MNLIRRFLPFLLSLAHAGALLVLYFQPKWLFALFSMPRISSVFVLSVLAFCLGLAFFALMSIGYGYHVLSRLRFYPFLAVSTTSAFIVFLYTDYRPILLGITFVVPAYTWIWTESLYLFWQQPVLYQPYTLQRLASYLYLLEIFLFVAAISGLQVLFLVPTWITLPVSAALYLFVQYDVLFLSRLDSAYAWKVAFVGTILAIQLQVVLQTLPTHFLLYSGLMTIFFYAWLGLTKQAANPQQPYTRRQVLPYALVSTLGAVMTFVSSLWIV